MRIVLVTNGLRYGGAERIVQAIAEDLAEHGDAVRVVATTRDGEIGEALRQKNIPVDVLGIRHAYDARVPMKLAKIIRAHKADVVHSHITVSDLANAAAHVLARDAKIASTVHSTYVGLSDTVRRAWHASLFLFHRVTVVSEAVKASLPHLLNTTLIKPSLVDHAPLDRANARKKLGIDQATPLVMAVGRLAHVKGFDVLARAADQIQIQIPNARIVIIGDGEERDALARAQPLLELLGSRDDAGALLAAADVAVMPSRSEGFPQVPLHAMAAGVPVVATDVGGMKEIVVDGVTGTLVPSEDPSALASAINALLADRQKAMALGAAGNTRLNTEGLTRTAMLRKIRALYESMR